MQRRTARHFDVLDGIRGVAAMAIVLVHSYRVALPNGPLAVDLFFILSGFVIANAYEERLVKGMSPFAFMKKRFIRLYPMFALGAAAGLAVALLHGFLDPSKAYRLGDVISSGIISLSTLPDLRRDSSINEWVFHFNPALWSVFFELVANLAYAVCIRWLTVRMVAAIVALSLLRIVLGHTLGGPTCSTFWLGVPRTAAGFFAGVLLFRSYARGRWPRFGLPFWALSLLLTGLFAIRPTIEGWSYLPAFALIVLIVVFGSVSQAGPRLRQVCLTLGRISYPLYAIHWITISIFNRLGLALRAPTLAVVVAQAIAAPLIAYVVSRVYEDPARRWLADAFGQRPAVRAELP